MTGAQLSRRRARLTCGVLESRLTPATLLRTLQPDNNGPPNSDAFGNAVAADESNVLVGARFDSVGAVQTGSAYVVDARTGVVVSRLYNPEPGAQDLFGDSVALAGRIAVVGAPWDDFGAMDAGSAYIFNSVTGSLIATLRNPTPQTADHFGWAVAIAGQTVLVGAPGGDSNYFCPGTVSMFDAATGAPTGVIDNPFPTSDSWFGSSLATSGNRLVVGAANNVSGQTKAGAGYVYDLSGPTPLVPALVLDNPNPDPNDYFGQEVAMAGRYVVIGAYGDDRSGPIIDRAGVAYAYDLEGASPQTSFAMLTKSTPMALDFFGSAIAVIGHHAVVGAYRDTTGAINSGSAYVFDLNSANPASSVANLENPTPGPFDGFGLAVAGAGNRLIIGASGDSEQSYYQGAAYVYRLIDPARVAAVEINEGAIQRSRVTSLQVTFDSKVTLPANPSDAFLVRRQADGARVILNAVVAGKSVTLTFTGGAVDFDSLADGRFTLTILADKINGGNFDGNGDGTEGDNFVLVGTPDNKLFRLFGDADGDADVDTGDFAAFRQSFGGASATFDFDNDGDVDVADLGQFRTRFGTVV